MDIIAVTALVPGLSQVELVNWVERGWVVPDAADSGLVFHEIDVARVRLIRDLRRDMDIGEDAVSLVLSLLDQVYELRSKMKSVLHVLESQPRDVQAALLDALRARGFDAGQNPAEN
jgi:chaperone modulatory protein CbpM